MRTSKYSDEEYIGKRYGHLEVIRYDIGKGFLVRCDCGAERYADGYKLTNGRIESCGKCEYHRLVKSEGATTTGNESRLFHIWSTMKNRCCNPNNPDYFRYGGRGIELCEEWKEYTSFREWAESEGYQEDGKYTQRLTRTDKNEGFNPGNCVWKTASKNRDKADRGAKQGTDQVKHKRTLYGKTEYRIGNETHTLDEWCKIYGVSREWVAYRVNKKNMRLDMAITGCKMGCRKKRVNKPKCDSRKHKSAEKNKL